MELPFLTIREASDLIDKGEISPVELTEAVLGRISELDGELNAYVTVLADRALEDARAAEKEIASGKRRGTLHGIPIALMVIFVMKCAPATCG